jgi:hypothetical protein
LTESRIFETIKDTLKNVPGAESARASHEGNEMPVTQTFDFIPTSGPLDGENIRHDIDNLHDLTSVEDVDRLMERVKIAIENIKAALTSTNARNYDGPGDYDDWKKRTQFSLSRYTESIKRINGYRTFLVEKRRANQYRIDRLQENIIAAERKRDEASVNALYQLSKNLGFIEALKKRGIIPREEWKDLWNEAEQIAFDRRREYEGVTYRKLEFSIARLRKELDAEGIEDDATG